MPLNLAYYNASVVVVPKLGMDDNTLQTYVCMRYLLTLIINHYFLNMPNFLEKQCHDIFIQM
jgi:hypothetical protein